MSGPIRNALTLVTALRQRGSATPQDTTVCSFIVTPFDVGLRTLKSDKYLALAESAQLDFLVKTRLAGGLVKSGTSFVNLSQLVWFTKPVHLWQRLEVRTQVAGADERCAWFRHDFQVGGDPAAQAWVKMKFKRGRLTVPPAEILGPLPPPPAISGSWDQTASARP